MPPRKLRSPLALVVLGLLAEEPMHPYAMRQRISERAHDRLPGVRPASLYDVVQRLSEAGLVNAGEPSREGNRPERIGYVITDAEAALAQAERSGVPPIFLSEHRYQLALRRADRDWIVAFTEALRTGTLTWPTHREGT
jgi:DNA-binding PadR family transcriptional regulator